MRGIYSIGEVLTVGEKVFMMWDSLSLTRLIDAAAGRRPVDLCIRGCRLVNVFTGRVETGDLAVHEGWIAGLGEYEAVRSIDAEGMYVCPGFIDGHIHIESSLLHPAQFCAAVLPWGTSAVAADPHEIANVLGLEGLRFFLDVARGLPLDIYLNLPSCVPASPLETSGAWLRAVDLAMLSSDPNVLGLAEVMNFPGVIHANPEVLDKLILFQSRVLDGHAPQVTGKDLNAYLAPGIASDHECTSGEEAREKLAKGMTIMIREGSQSKDLANLISVVDDHSWPRCIFVSDDRHPDDLLREGHMNAIVNRAMALGLDPVRAITMATWNTAQYFRMPRRGALAPGYRADFCMSPTLNPWTPMRVFKDGVEVARDGSLLADPALWPRLPAPASPMNIPEPSVEQLRVPWESGRLRVIGVQEGSLLTSKMLFEPRVMDGLVVSDVERDILKIAVYNRYVPGKSPAVGFVHGLGLREGAIATSVAHDSHNIIAAGASDAAMVRLVGAIRENGGGMAIGGADGPLEILPLPIAGLMSDQPLERVVESLDALKARAEALGSGLRNPFMALSFLALPVIPELKLTDLGLVDASTFSLTSLFE